MPNIPGPLDDEALAGTWQGTAPLRRGVNAHDAVAALQGALSRLGHVVPVDGVFGDQVQRILKCWQAARSLQSDGVVGPRTLTALAAALTAPALSESRPARRHSRPPTPGPGEPVAGLYRQDRFPGRIAFTFDDGPDPSHTPTVLHALSTAGVHGTFFMLGSKAQARPDLVRRVAAAGHEIGNHSWSHPNFMEISTDAVRQQLHRTQATIASILGTGRFFHVRPPYGSPFHSSRAPASAYWEPIGQVLQDHGAQLMMWQVDTWDWKYRGRPWEVVQRFRAELGATHGGALLMHDIHLHSAEALPAILDVVRQAGLQVVSTEALLADKYTRATS